MVLICAFSVQSQAKDSFKAPFFVTYPSKGTCAEFLAHTENKAPSDPMDHVATAYLGWFWGFLTGVNYALGSQYQSDNQVMFYWVRRFCTTHPNANIAAAALGYVKEVGPLKGQN